MAYVLYGGVGMAKDYDIARYFLKQAIANGDPETKELAESGLAAMEYEIYSLEHPIEEDADYEDYWSEFADIFNDFYDVCEDYWFEFTDIFNNFNEIQDETEGFLNGHEWEDLGLPSGTKWATCNIGASSPFDYGNYYAWCETSTKSSYTKANSKTDERNIPEFSGNTYYDAATANWGKGWRMPNHDEFKELREFCKLQWEQRNGVYGLKITGPNGCSIFLPAGGRMEETALDSPNCGFYWSSRPYFNKYDCTSILFFFFPVETIFLYSADRYIGHLVRPVTDK